MKNTYANLSKYSTRGSERTSKAFSRSCMRRRVPPLRPPLSRGRLRSLSRSYRFIALCFPGLTVC
jgi:hypothetical protein